MSAIDILRDSWSNRDKIGDSKLSEELTAFLPAALEIQDTPPNPLARKLAWSLLLLLLIGVGWACFGHVNIVASAEGKIIPSSRVKQVQPLEKGVVEQVLVREGETVSRGQPVIELDTTTTRADKARLESDIRRIGMRLVVNQSLLEMLKLPEARAEKIVLDEVDISSVDAADSGEIELHRQLLWQQWKQFRAQLQALKNALAKTRAEQSVTKEVISKLEQTLPIVTRRVEKLEELHENNFVSEIEYLEVEQERIQQSQDLAAERYRLEQLLAAETEVNEQVNQLRAESRITLLSEITDQQRQLSALKEELNKAEDINAKQVLYAPVDGRVQELAVNTVGGVVTEAQQLMLIVPNEEQLEVEVFLENKDIGFVHEGMPAEIKVHTFPFTKYGVIDAEVSTVSSDAIVDEQRGLIFSMRLQMGKNTIPVDGKDIALIPGMAVTAEVKTGKRRIIEFFLAPLLRHGGESLRER